MEDVQETVVTVPVDAEQETSIESSETVVSTEVDAPKDDNVGQAIKAEVARREAQLQKQYEEQIGTYKQQTAYLEKQAKIYGYSTVDEYTRAVDEHLAQQEIEQAANRMNVDPDTYAQYFQPVNQELNELRTKLSTYEQQQVQQQQQQENNQKWGELYTKYPQLLETAKGFEDGSPVEWYNTDMQQLVSQGYQPIHAYEIANQQALFKQREQETLARITGRDERQVLPSTDPPGNVQFDPSNMSDADIESISRRVQSGERITF